MRLKLTNTEIAAFKPSVNRILIKPDFSQSKVSGMSIDTRYQPQKHAPVSGVVIAVCRDYNTELLPQVPEKIDVAVGDYVIYTHESATYYMDEANHNRQVVDDNGDIYFVADYEDLIVSRRGNNLIPHNGYLLVSMIMENKNIGLKTSDVPSSRYGVIEVIGSKNILYRNGKTVRDDKYDPNLDLKVGDVVSFSVFSDIAVEHSSHASISEKKLFRMNWCDIETVLNPQDVFSLKI